MSDLPATRPPVPTQAVKQVASSFDAALRPDILHNVNLDRARYKPQAARVVSTVVVGGGVVGLSLAWELSRRGRSVLLLEAGQVGRGASWAGAGILPPTARCGTEDPYEQLRAMSHNLHAQWAERLCVETGIDTGYTRCGGVYLARTAGEAATLAANCQWWRDHGIEHEAWTLEQLALREPELVPTRTSQASAAHPTNRAQSAAAPYRAMWYLPDECQLRNPHHLQALAIACRQQGVEIHEQAALSQVEPLDNGRLQVTTAQGTFQAEQVCICSGAWARQTLQQHGLANGILPVRGQMVLYRCQRPLINSVINEGHRYLVARRDGRLLAGSVEEEVGYVIETTDAAIAQIRQWAEGVLPALKNQTVERTWAGLRPGSFDGFPYLGVVPGFENMFLAAGHFRSGLHLSCATAVVMANVMHGQPNTIDLHPFRVGRG